MDYISIRNRNTKNFDEIAFLNQQSFSYYSTQLRQLATSLFKWNNLPNGIPERFIEKMLYYHGTVAFFEDSLLGYIVTKCTSGSALNIYEEPVFWNCFGIEYNKNVRSKDCVIIRNNIDMIPTSVIVQYYSQKLWMVDVALNQNISLQKFSALCKCSESQRLTFENLMLKYQGGQPLIFAKKDLDTDGLDVLSFDIPFIANDLQKIKSDIFNECLSTFGVNNANTNKRERLNSDEVNANNQYLDLSLDNMFLYRQRACEEINEKFNLNVSVEIREKRNNDDYSLEVGEGDNNVSLHD